MPIYKVFHYSRATPFLFFILTSSSIRTMSTTAAAATSPTTVTSTTMATNNGSAAKAAATATTAATPTTPTPTGVAARLARPNILELSPYRCARDDYSEGILLDANENGYGPALSTTSTSTTTDPIDSMNLDIANADLHRYPDPYQIPLKQRLAKHRGFDSFITPAHVFVGVGSDEAIDLLMRIFGRPGPSGDAILTTPPTYGMYKVCAKVNDLSIVNVPLTPDFDLRVPEILNAITPQVKLIFLCSPGNPTAKALPLADIERVISSPQAQNAIVVVDEAYIDFHTAPHASAVELVQKYANVVVLQTLSKAFGLAAIRCGFCIGPPDIIQLLNNVKAPYNINCLTSRLANQAFDEIARDTENNILAKNIRMILEQRVLVMKELEKLPFVTKVYESQANFVLFKLEQKAQQVYKQMADSGVVIRFRGNEMHCAECLRVTIGTPDENQAFLKRLVETYQAVTATA